MQKSLPHLRSLREFLRENRWFFLVWAAVAIAFRLVFFFKFRLLTDDTFVYGDLAKNWLQHHVYGVTTAHGAMPTYIRLPGYPLFLAIIWKLAAVEHYNAVLLVQIAVDLVTCFIIADLARRFVGDRAAKVAFALAALCPFFANFAAVGLTETLAIFFAALAMDTAVAGLDKPYRLSRWVVCGLAVGGGILLRPDGGMLLAVIGVYLLLHLMSPATPEERRSLFVGGVLLAVLALGSLVPWTIRNWRTFHHFEPLTPVYANMPDEFVPQGFHRWVRTWMIDYASVEDVWFKVDGTSVDVDDIPRRAFDNSDQLQRTVQAFSEYDDNGNTINPEIDAKFSALAQDRIHQHPLRYYVELPFLRATDLWLRPRTETLPVDPHWWRYGDDWHDFAKALALAIVNVFFLLAALAALAMGRVRYAGLFILLVIVRTAFLAWMPNPEPRYMLECYPAVLAMAGAAFGRR